MARCEFHTPDGSEVRLNGDTEVRFETPRHLGLTRGQVMATVMTDPAPFEVEVARATVTALVDTRLWVLPRARLVEVGRGSPPLRAALQALMRRRALPARMQAMQ